jgi:PilZ domain-containing protein
MSSTTTWKGYPSDRMPQPIDNDPPESGGERRSMRRFDMRLPASVRITGEMPDQLLTETMNVSARGVFFYVDKPVVEGSQIEVTLTFPPHVTLTDSVRVRFTAKIIRVENPLPASRIGVAAMIEDYEFLKAGNSLFSQVQ